MNISNPVVPRPPPGGLGASSPGASSGAEPRHISPAADATAGLRAQPSGSTVAPGELTEPLEAVKAAIEVLNQTIGNSKSSVQFQLDELSGRSVVRVVDTTTQELIRQYPTEEFMDIARTVTVISEGLLFRTKA